jgi:threonine/homoserine/homoserine lactone efflux protein
LLAFFLQGLVLGIPAAATPGPLQAYFLSQTLRVGWQKTLPSVLAPLISDGPIIVLVLLILTRIPVWLLQSLRMVGGIFILYLAIIAIVGFRRSEINSDKLAESSHKGILRATVTNLLNPNPYIFWSLVAGPILLTAWRESVIHGASFMLGFYGTFISGLTSLILLFALAGRFGPNMVKAFSILAITALIFFGLYQIGTGLWGMIWLH